MAIVEIIQIPVICRGKPTKKMKLKMILKCDECSRIYEAPRYSQIRAPKSKHHFCSKKCSVNSHSNGVLREVSKKTNMEKYGAECFASSTIGRKILNEVLTEKFGHISPFKNQEIKNKIKQTNLEKYGKEYYTGTPDHLSKIDHKAIAQKAWKTKIKNGSCSKSKPEERLYKILISRYGKENVKRQINMIGQWVDFFITNINLYIQVDGIYWHGLNRPLREIKLQKTSQDVKIYKQILRDRKLNKYMKINHIKLLRITDDEINERTDQELLNLISEKI